MNRDNIQRMINHLTTLQPEQFDMQYYDRTTAGESYKGMLKFMDNGFKCFTAGCTIGNCIQIDKNLMMDVMAREGIAGMGWYCIEWARRFTGIHYTQLEFDWCFSQSWYSVDNTITGAISRLQAVLNGNWREHENYKQFLNLKR